MILIYNSLSPSASAETRISFLYIRVIRMRCLCKLARGVFFQRKEYTRRERKYMLCILEKRGCDTLASSRMTLFFYRVTRFDSVRYIGAEVY